MRGGIRSPTIVFPSLVLKTFLGDLGLALIKSQWRGREEVGHF